MGDPAIINDVINQTSYAGFFCIGSASLRPSICKGQIVTSPVKQIFSLSQSSCVSPVELIDGRGGEGAKSYDGEKKAWSSL
jgi:hypothetical protein